VDITPTFAGRLASALHGSVADDPQFIAQELDPERLKQSKRELEAVFIQAWPAQTPGELKKGDRVERGSGATYEVGVVEEVGLRGAMITWDRGIKTWAARADLRVVPTCPHQGPTG
jgi:hypothetical protein